jgi:dolichol-phosphate mannosyltransferase
MEMDADHSHNPRDIPRLVEAVLKGYDLAIGSRYIADGNIIGWGIYRKMVSKGANTLAALILQISRFAKDVTSGYRAYRVKVLNQIDMSAVKSSGYAFQLDMLVETLRNGFKVKEVPITFVDRRIGESKLGLNDILGFFLTVLRVRFKKIRL